MVANKDKKAANRASGAGGISKRRSTRADRDGDIAMDASSRPRGGGISKATRGAPAARRGATSGANGGTGSDRPARAERPNVNTSRLQRAVMNHVGSDNSIRRASAPANRGPEEIRVSGWKSAKGGSLSDDSGVATLVAWIEKKATLKSKRKPVRVKKSHVEGDDLLITVAAEDAPHILRMDKYVWGGKNIKIKRASEALDLEGAGTSESTTSTIAMLKTVLERRYNVQAKLLDLSSLALDPDLKASSIFDSNSATSKFFPAMMVVLEKQFENDNAKNEAVTSVSLAGNALPDLSIVTTLSSTLPKLKNLDLSNNAFKDLSAIKLWRRRLSQLEQIILTGNPLEQNEPDYAAKIMHWWPKLRTVNGVEVRSAEEAAKGLQAADLPFPILHANFQDEGQIAENFLRTFYNGYDTDRATLANYYYDDRSDFSMSLNTSAPRDPNTVTQAQEWDLYLKRSRNLKKLTHQSARQTRHYRGPKAITDAWSTLPVSRHPDLTTEANKWLIECQLQPGIPDPTGASPVGVDGFLITVHGQYDELDVSTGTVTKTRSFDRTFILGPGGPTGIRVVSDLLTIRAYGGFAAFEPDAQPTVATVQQQQQAAQQQLADPSLATLPAGTTIEMAEQMVLALQKQTGMTIAYSKMCLGDSAWDFDRALQMFAAARPSLGPEAFEPGFIAQPAGVAAPA